MITFIDYLDYLYERGIEWEDSYMWVTAIYDNHIDVMQWLHDHGYELRIVKMILYGI